jgi:hypothetical protein
VRTSLFLPGFDDIMEIKETVKHLREGTWMKVGR